MSDTDLKELAAALVAFQDAKREAFIKGHAYVKVTKVRGNYVRFKWVAEKGAA